MEFDHVTEKVLKSVKPSISDSLRIFGIDQNESFEKRKNFSKFNLFTETTLTGFKSTTSETFDEKKKYDDLTLDCSEMTVLRAYVTYIYIFKSITETQNSLLKNRLIGLKNSLNLYLVFNKDKVDLKSFEAFTETYETINSSNVSTNSDFLRKLRGESLMNMNSVEYIMRKIDRQNDFEYLKDLKI